MTIEELTKSTNVPGNKVSLEGKIIYSNGFHTVETRIKEPKL